MRISAILRGMSSIGIVNYQGIQFRASGSTALPIEVGMILSAKYEKNEYSILGITSTVHGWPSPEASIGHPNWRGQQEAVVTTEEGL